MRNVKRLLGVIGLLSLFVVGLAACSNSDADSTASSASSSGNTAKARTLDEIKKVARLELVCFPTKNRLVM